MRRASLLAFVWFIFTSGGAYPGDSDKISEYLYEDTRQLVALVEDAASLIEREGASAFPKFGISGSRWLSGKRYVFVYDLGGTCVFHPVEPDLVGQELMGLVDLDGRPVVAMITEVGTRPAAGASGWVFYLWEEQANSSVPAWKGSYVRKAVAPDGTVYVVGSGLHNPKMEKRFVQEHVDRAAALVLAKGKADAFEELRHRASPLHLPDTYVTVMDSLGNLVVDPSFPTLTKKRSFANFRDKSGRVPYAEITESLQNADRMWLSYIWPKGDRDRLARHLMYARKVTVDGEIFYVSATFVPATPVWMK